MRAHVVCETTPCQGGRVQQPSFAETPRRDPLAQLAEHLTFNQGVRSSNLRWVTIFPIGMRVDLCGRGGMADAPDLGSGAERRKSSSLFVRTTPQMEHAVVAQW